MSGAGDKLTVILIGVANGDKLHSGGFTAVTTCPVLSYSLDFVIFHSCDMIVIESVVLKGRVS